MSISKTVNIIYLITIITIVFGCSDLVKDEKGKDSKKKPDISQYEGPFLNPDTEASDKLDLLEELNEVDDPEVAVILISGLFDSDEEVQQEALSVLEGYRRFILSDLDLSFYNHLDKWFRKHPLTIINMMGYKKDYLKFIDALENRGRRTRYYEKNPIRFLIKSNELFKIMEERLEKTEPIIQFWTCWIIGESQIDYGIPYLIRVLRKKSSNRFLDERCVAAWSLSKFKNKSLSRWLINHIEEENHYLQEAISIAIGDMKDYSFSTLFLDLLKSKSVSSHLKLGVIWALTKINERRVIPIIENDLKESFHWIKIQQFWSLYRFGARKTPSIVVKSLTSKKNIVLEAALLVIKKIDDSSIASELISLLKNKSSKIKNMTVKLLGKWEVEEAIPAIIPLLEDSDESVQENSIIALGEIASTKGIPPLLKLLSNEGKPLSLKLIVVKALMEIGEQSTLKNLLSFYEKVVLSEKSKSDKKFPALSEILIILANKEDLFKLFESPLEKVKLEAIKSIPYFEEDIEDFEFLVSLLKGASEDIQVEIIRVMGYVEYDDAFTLLVKIMSSTKVKSKLKQEAIRSLGKLKNRKATRRLVELLDSQDKLIKLVVIEALGYLGDLRGVSALKKEYKYSKSVEEKVLIILSLSLLGKRESKHMKYLVKMAKKPSEKAKLFFLTLSKIVSYEIKNKLLKSLLVKATSSEKKILKDFLSSFTKEEKESKIK